jgi:MFS family permease
LTISLPTFSTFLQGVNYYITLWYRRRECAFRAAIFFSAATVAGAFGGLLARGINEMNGVGGKPGWAWIFILEGILTVFIAIISFWAISDNPRSASFLTEEETMEVQKRLKHDSEDLAEYYDTKFMWIAFADWKIWLQCVCVSGRLNPSLIRRPITKMLIQGLLGRPRPSLLLFSLSPFHHCRYGLFGS